MKKVLLIFLAVLLTLSSTDVFQNKKQTIYQKLFLMTTVNQLVHRKVC